MRNAIASKLAATAGLAALAMAGSVSAATVEFNTSTPGTGFGGGSSLTLDNTSGAAATLTFIPALSSVTGTPSNVNFGNFTLVCATCTTQAVGAGSTFGAFAFDLVVADTTHGATGQFVGSSAGGEVFSDVSTISVAWMPLMVGPGTNNALTGDFGPAQFSLRPFISIVAPNSGAVPGQSTVEGFVNSDDIAVIPVPGSALLALSGLAMLGLIRRKRPVAVKAD